MTAKLAFTIVAAAVAAGSSVAQGMASREASKAEAEQAKLNAELAKNQADIDSEERLRTLQRTVGSQAALYAARQIDPTQGSALSVRAEESRLAGRDVRKIRTKAKLDAAYWNTQAAATERAGRQAFLSGLAGGFSQFAEVGAEEHRFQREKELRADFRGGSAGSSRPNIRRAPSRAGYSDIS
jgi:hypothetical protein